MASVDGQQKGNGAREKAGRGCCPKNQEKTLAGDENVIGVAHKEQPWLGDRLLLEGTRSSWHP